MILNAEEQHAVEQFLYTEAALLDEHRYSEWLDLFTEDCRYWMPVRQTRLRKQEEQEFTRPGEIAYFDETKNGLAMRVKKLQSAYAWGESPAPRTRHMCTNVRALSHEGAELTISCNFAFYRSALELSVDWFVGRREDVLRGTNGEFKIAKRSIFLDQTVITAKNMNHFF